MSTPPSLHDFVLSRWSEQHAAAQDEIDLAARYRDPDDDRRFVTEYQWHRVVRSAATDMVWSSSFATGAPSPAQVIADIEGKREVLALVGGLPQIIADVALRAFAMPFDTHPDYQPEWALETHV